MSAIVEDIVDWGATRDKDGHRFYNIDWLVRTTDVLDGPNIVFGASGLPLIGSTWAFGNDSDLFAYCWPDWKVKPLVRGERDNHWVVSQTFTTKPLERCQDTSVDNPLTEPDRLSGSFVKYTQEMDKDKDGKAIKTSSHEVVRGSVVEFDANRPQVIIEKNILILPLGTIADMVDTVNDNNMWGLTKRMVKLSDVSWSRKLYGSCTFYFVVSYTFDVDKKTFDRKFLDEGTKVLQPGGTATNPTHFDLYKDSNGQNTKVLLNGSGAALTDANSPVFKDVKYYPEKNFFQLGIPAIL